MLRSFRLGEADRVLHLYTLDARARRRGREGRPQDEVPLRRAARAVLARRAPAPSGLGRPPDGHRRLARRPAPADARGLVPAAPSGSSARRRCCGSYVEEERNERAFEALDALPRSGRRLPAGLAGRAALDPLALAFQLKLLWLSGYVPHLESCVECGGVEGSSATCRVREAPSAPPARRPRRCAVARRPPRDLVAPLEPARGRARPRARGARGTGRPRGRRRVVRVPRRLPPEHAVGVKRDLGDGYELDDDPARIDREAVHRYLSEESYWAAGRPRDVQDELIDTALPRRRPLPRRRAGRLLAHDLRRPRAVVPRRRLRARRASRPRARRRARPLQRRRRPVRADEVVPAHAPTRTTSTASSASRSPASGRSSAGAARRARASREPSQRRPRHSRPCSSASSMTSVSVATATDRPAHTTWAGRSGSLRTR